MELRTVLTYEDYAALPADGRRYEVHEGELLVTPAPGTRHQEVKANLFDSLRHHVKRHGLGKLFDGAAVDVTGSRQGWHCLFDRY